MDPTPEPHEIEDVASLEWRRYFDADLDRTALVVAAVAGLVSVFVVRGAFLAFPSNPATILMWSCGVALTMDITLFLVGLSGAFPVRRKRIGVVNGITIVRNGWHLPAAIGSYLTFLGPIAFSVGMITWGLTGDNDLASDRRFPSFVIYTGALIAIVLWMVLFMKKGSRFEFSPQGLTGRFSSAVIRVPWDSIHDVSIYRGRSPMRPFGLGRKCDFVLTTTSEATFPRTAPGFDTKLYPIGLTTFGVDEDTLFNVIHAAHTHPEVRELFGREEGTILFDGPPAKPRKAMPVSEIWTPWGQKIRATLDAQAGAEHAAKPSEKKG